MACTRERAFFGIVELNTGNLFKTTQQYIFWFYDEFVESSKVPVFGAY
jgi:hypothetical protein